MANGYLHRAFGSERTGMALEWGLQGHLYTGDPVRYYNENSKMKNIQREIKEDNHKMSEDFNNKISKRDIEAVNNMLVRPEGW